MQLEASQCYDKGDSEGIWKVPMHIHILKGPMLEKAGILSVPPPPFGIMSQNMLLQQP